MTPEPDTPPTAAEERATRSRRTTRRTVDDQLRESLSGTYETVGMLAIGFSMRRGPEHIDPGLFGTGTQLVTHKDAAADAWMDLAEKNAKVKAALRRFTEGSSTAVLIGLHVSMAIPLLASRGIVPEQVADAMMAAAAAQAQTENGTGD